MEEKSTEKQAINFTHHPSHTKDESHKELKHTLEFLIRENELK
jgi:hypothetical protein